MKAINLKKSINKAKSLAALSLALLALALAGCQQAADSGDMALALAGAQKPDDGGQAYVTLSLANKASAPSAADGVSASALPDSAQAVFGRFELSGISSQQGVSPISWSCGDGKSDARQELDVAKVSAKKGAAYNFTLTATTLGGAQYSDTIPYTVQGQGNLLSFNLRLLSVGTGSGQSQQGSAAITVNLPSGGKGGQVNRVAASVYKLNDDGSLDNDPVAGFDNIDVPIESGAANFNASIDAGVYCAVFDLYGGEDGKILLGTWREYFGVAEGQTSASTLNPAGGADGDQVDEVHSITYNKNDDAIDPALVSAPESFSRLTVRTLSQIKAACLRPNYRIHSWYTDELLTQEFSSTIGINGDIALWANKWDTLLFIKIPDRYEHGSATAKPEGDDQGNPAIAGEEVTITPSPDDGWVTGDITITAVDSAGNALNPQPDGYPKTIDRAATPKTFVMPDLSYCQGVKVDVDFLATVTFAENKSAGAAADDTAASSGSMQPQIFAVNTQQALNANGFAIVGWTFAGWNTAADASGTPYADGAAFTTDAPATLYAQWTPNADTEYKVQHYKQKADLTSYELVGSDTETKTGTTWTDTNVTSSDAKDYDGFTIKAGSPANAKIKADGSAVVPIYYDRNSYTVTFNGNGATSGSTADQTFYYGVPKALNANGYQKTDYDFKGWASSPGGAKDYDDKASYTIDGGSPSDKNLYAFWTKKTFKLNLNAGTGGTVSAKYTASGAAIPSGGDVEWDSAITITIAPKSGYALEQVSGIGWPDLAQLSREFTMPKDAVTIEVAFVQTVPEGFALIQGATVTAPTGVESRVFVQGRTLTFPPLYVSDHEVTQSEYETYCMYYSSGPTDQYGIGPNLPAYRVTWFDAIVYCNLRSIADGFAPVYTIEGKTDPKKWTGVKKTGEGANAKYCAPNGYPHDDIWSTVTCDWTANGYRLPSEAEWEYLARGGCPDLSPNEYGGAPTEAEVTNYAWCKGNSGGKVHDVKTKLPNGIGLYDMCGNVYEMCWDWYSAPIKTDTPEHGPARPSSTYTLHVVCGSSYTDPSPNIRAINQNASGTGSFTVGFRVVRTAQ